MVNNKMNQDEVLRIASEEDACYKQASEEEQKRVQEEVDICWAEFAELAEEITDEVMATLDEISVSEVDTEKEKYSQKEQDPRAYRRKMQKRIEKRLCRIATDAMNNLEKRSSDEKNGSIIKSARALELWHEAKRKKLVEGDCPE